MDHPDAPKITARTDCRGWWGWCWIVRATPSAPNCGGTSSAEIQQAVKDRQDREAMVASSRDALQKGDQSLVGNRGYRRFLRATGEHCTIDEDKMQQEERYDGQWVLTTNAALSARFEVRCSVRF